MIALTDDVYTLWTNTLTRLVAETSDRWVSQVPLPADPDMMWIRQLWPNGAKVIDYETAAGLCGGIGLIIPPEVAVKQNVSATCSR
jgi:phosphatidylinositol phospholipase C delta